MFGGIYQSDSLVVPAFKVNNFDAMYKLCKRMSSALPQFTLKELSKTTNSFKFINLPFNEAVLLAGLFIHKDKYKRSASVKDTDTNSFIPIEKSLFFIPFHPENYFYVDSILNAVTFEKKLID